MIFLVGVFLALFVFPDGWEVPAIIGFGLLEIAETTITWRLSRLWAPRFGPETLIGATGRAVTDCRPAGTVRVQSEEWGARSDSGVTAGDAVRVVERQGLTLIVERADEPRNRA